MMAHGQAPDGRDDWQALSDAELVRGAMPDASAVESPWYVRLMLGIAGWIAAIFLLGFIAAGMAWVLDNTFASIVTGLLMLGIAWLLLVKTTGSDFAAQFALAVSFSGQALVAYGLFDHFGWEPPAIAAWASLSLLQLALAVVMPSAVHRLWSAFAAATAFYMALNSTVLAFTPPLLIMATAAWAWINEFKWLQHGTMIRPMAYGLVLACIATDWAASIDRSLEAVRSFIPAWSEQLLFGAVSLWVVWRLLHRYQVAVPGRVANAALAAVTILVLASLKAPGISLGVCILLLGFAHGNRVLASIGAMALLVYLGSYYYTLETTLLVKSQTLALTGAVLLTLRWLMNRWLFSSPKGADG
jgi:hypothetical protein